MSLAMKNELYNNPEENGQVFTSGIHRAQLTCAHFVPVLVAFMAPPLFGHKIHCG